MSADCYRLCPACNTEREAERSIANDALAESIKNDSLTGYRTAQKGVAEAYESLTESLREDYEIYTDERGEFHVNYGCSCSKCGFTFTFKHAAAVDLNNRPYKKQL